MLEAWAADFLFQLPDEIDIQWEVILDRVARRHHRGQCRPFIVGCSTPFIAAVLFEKTEGRFVPFVGISRLDIHMIVDSQSRIVRAGLKAPKHDRMAWSLDNFRLSPDRLKKLARKRSPSTNVVLALGVHADRRALDLLGYCAFEIVE